MSKFPKLLFVAMMATASAPLAAEFIANTYKYQSLPNIPDWNNKYPEWSLAAYQQGIANAINWNTVDVDNPNVTTYSRSPAFFWKRDPWNRHSFYSVTTGPYYDNPTVVNDGRYYMAHRGLVQMRQGIAENTLDAVHNAVQNGMNIIELDVQASKDGRPMVIHDDFLTRTTTRSTQRVDYYTAGDMLSWNTATVMKDPERPSDDIRTTPTYCANGNQLMTFDTIYNTLQGKSGYSREPIPGRDCGVYDRITYFLDPKNLNSGKSVFQFIADDERSGTEKRKFFVKTYDNFWAPEDATLSPGRALAGIPTITRNKIQVAPVISIRSYLDQPTPDYDGAVNYAKSIVRAWTAAGARVSAVEFPGAWDDRWNIFTNRFYTEIMRNPDLYYGNNPQINVQVSATTANKVTLVPVPSYGYRFPDYQYRYTYSYGGSAFYNWSMRGQGTPDFTNQFRGILGASYQFTNICKSGITIAINRYNRAVKHSGCFVTTDFPHWEMQANGAGPSNEPKVSEFRGSPEREFGDNDQP